MYERRVGFTMAERTGFLGSATVGTKGQIVIPADARKAMQIKEGDKVVVLRGPREGSVLVFRVDSFDVLLQKAGIADDERTAMEAQHKPTR
jgi:AbrB family looped-hinge helix DNA binding protein